MSNPLDRRAFVSKSVTGAVTGAVTVAGGAALSACGPTDSGGSGDLDELDGAPAVQTGGQRLLWRLASSFPPSLDTLYGAAEVLAEELLALTGGRFQIRVYPAGELVPAFQVMDAVQQGTVQCAHTASYYFTGKNPVLAYDCTVPFGLTPRQQIAWLKDGGGLELMQAVYADFNIINFTAGNVGGQMGGWFRREINSPADMRGLKMRIPGLGGRVMDRLGVAVQTLPGGDIFPALERGAIDATEWVGPYDDEKLGLHQAADFYYYPGWWEPGASISALVNVDAWASLSSEYQAAFKAAATVATERMLTRYDVQNPPALRRLVDGGTQLRAFSPEIMAAARAAATEMYEEDAEADATYREIYEAARRFTEETREWFGIELAYPQYALRPLG